MTLDRLAIFLLLLAASPAAILLVHMVLSRSLRSAPPQIVAVLAMAGGLVPEGALLWIFFFRHLPPRTPEFFSAVLYALIVYGGIAYSYFHVFNMSETARRIRIFREIHLAGTLTAQDILKLYSASDIVKVRLERLKATGQLEFADGRYRVRGRSLYLVAVLIEHWRALLGYEAVKRAPAGDEPELPSATP